MRASDKFNISFNPSINEKLDIPAVFSSDEERRKTSNRFSKPMGGPYLDTPELDRFDRFPTRARAQILTPPLSSHRDNVSPNSRSSSGSLRKVTRIGGGANGGHASDDENVEPDDLPFAIPAQFQNDPEFMRSVDYGRPKRPIRPTEKITLPDISTFSEFETGKANKATRQHKDRISVNSIPIDQTSKAIHSIFGNYVSNANDLKALKRSLKEGEYKLRSLEEQLHNKNREFERLQHNLSQTKSSSNATNRYQQPDSNVYQSTTASNNVKPVSEFFQQNDSDNHDRQPDSNVYQSSFSAPNNVKPCNVFSSQPTSEPQINHSAHSEADHLNHELLIALESERDYYKRLAEANSAQEKSGRYESSRQEPQEPQEPPQASYQRPPQRTTANAGPDQLSHIFDRLRALKAGDAAAQTGATPIPSSTSGRAAFSEPSLKADRITSIFNDECMKEQDDPNKTMRPVASPQEAAINLYHDLKASYDDKYQKLSMLVKEYKGANPAYDRQRRRNLQEDIVKVSEQVEHDANLIYMLNDIALAFNLHLPAQDEAKE